MLPACLCAHPGYCPHLKRDMPTPVWQDCRQHASVRAFLEELTRAAAVAAPAPIPQPERSGPCYFLGAPTGEERLCAVCPGEQIRRVFACAHPAHLDGTTLPECLGCGHYWPRRVAE